MASEQWIDAFSRGLATRTSRKDTLKLIGAAVVGLFAANRATVVSAQPACLPHLTRCGSRCVNLKTNRDHCGSCKFSCEGEEFCRNGQCVEQCGRPFLRCPGTNCVDASRDPDNCGRCGNKCDVARTERCINGICVCPGRLCTTPQQTLRCCPQPQGVCCRSGQCCRPGEVCAGSGRCCTRRAPRLCAGDFCCPVGNSCCNSSRSCCPLGAGATCCPGGGCCPAGSRCTFFGRCLRSASAGGVQTEEIFPQTPTVPAAQSRTSL